MEKMNLMGDSPKIVEGSAEIPGMVSIYLVRLSSGHYYVDEPKEGRTHPQTTQYWHAAKFMFLATGRIQATKIAQKYGGEVCIVNCTKVVPYKRESTRSVSGSSCADIAATIEHHSKAYLYCSELSEKTILFTVVCNAMCEFLMKYRDAKFWEEAFQQAHLVPGSGELADGLLDCFARAVVINCIISLFRQCAQSTGSRDCRYLFERQLSWLEQEQQIACDKVRAYSSEIQIPELFSEFTTHHKKEVRDLLTALTT